jgi:CBS domain containing-hemolysin-like protein
MIETWLLYVLCGLAALLGSAFFSGAETGIYCVNRVRLHLRDERQDRSARPLVRLLADEQSALSTALVGTNICNYALTAVVALFIGRQLGLDDRSVEIYTTVVVTPVVFAFGEVVPKNAFRVAADRLMYPAALALQATRYLLLPVVWLTRHVTSLVTRAFSVVEPGGDSLFAARRRVATVLREGLLHVGSDPEHFGLVERVLALSSTPVHAAMVPRNRVVAVRAGAGPAELRDLARRTPHTRLPVYEHDVRRITGAVVVHRVLVEPARSTIRDAIEPVLSIAPHDTVAATIIRMREEKQTMAVVVNRNGLLLGLVTLKDLMEEIVGELTEW